jgi:hypothetical protein
MSLVAIVEIIALLDDLRSVDPAGNSEQILGS